MKQLSIEIAGGGIVGLWQAYVLGRAGHRVRLSERSAVAFSASASRWAGAMIAPDCEAEAAPAIVRDLGRAGLGLWRQHCPLLVNNGTLVVALPRDYGELDRFARLTERHRAVDAAGVADLEPLLAGRFGRGLYYADEAHLDAMAALDWLVGACRVAGAQVDLGSEIAAASSVDVLIDCRGMAAREVLPGLRGVRGERVMVAARDVQLSRPVRLLHPRQPLYVVPQGDGRFVVGATVVEREDDGPMTVRSALGLLGSAYALSPAFAEAAIIDMGAGVRPAFADNVPRIIVEGGGRVLRVNGAYRHGFLLAPVLAEAVAAHLAAGVAHPLIVGG